MTAIAEALHQAHLHLVIHRDVKPANILVDALGKPYLADFGLALKEKDFGDGWRSRHACLHESRAGPW